MGCAACGQKYRQRGNPMRFQKAAPMPVPVAPKAAAVPFTDSVAAVKQEIVTPPAQEVLPPTSDKNERYPWKKEGE